MKGVAMERKRKQTRQGVWLMGLLAIGCMLFLLACSQEGGPPSDLSKKAPPSLGAIAEVDGSDDTKKEGQKPPAGTEQTPAQSPAGGQPAPAAPKQ